MTKQDLWTKEQTIVVLNLYCKIPFNKVSSSHPEIIKIANVIGRSPNAVKMKIGNFGSFDPELKSRGIVGLANTSRLDALVWNEFENNWDNLAYESELLISQFLNRPIEETSKIEIDDIPMGKEREGIIKQRVNQSFFRSTILASYNLKCCITGLAIPDFLVASHIIPWAKDENNRLNPRNGVCLNSLHDKAFDRGFITITKDYKVQVSNYIIDYEKDESIDAFFRKFDRSNIYLPEKFLPSQEFLEYHNENIFIK